MKWNTQSINDGTFPQILSRRIVLSIVSHLYDPIGFLVPFTLKAKILMREMCTSKNDNSNSYWDDPVTDEIYYKYRDFVEELPKV